jgi:hypothetical protein
VASLTACELGSSGDRSGVPDFNAADLGRFEKSEKPYFYVGRSFDGLRLRHVQPYDAGVASLVYGTCDPPPEGGCPPPLELQHRLCRGRVTVVIYVGADPKPGRAARAARALRALSRGARGVLRPSITFDRAPAC